MFLGHFAVGFGAKKVAPGISLGVLFIAAQFLDLLWPVLILFNVEHVVISPGITKATPLDFTDYPISHSLVMAIVWGLLMGLITWLVVKNRRYAIVIGLCVVSHWILDLIVHRPDLPLYPGSATKAGFGLWNYPLLTAVIEIGMFIAGVYLYLKETTAKNGFGRYGVWVLAALLLLTHVANMTGPPPPSVTMIAWAGQLQWIFVILAFFVDKNRRVPVISV